MGVEAEIGRQIEPNRQRKRHRQAGRQRDTDAEKEKDKRKREKGSEIKKRMEGRQTETRERWI